MQLFNLAEKEGMKVGLYVVYKGFSVDRVSQISIICNLKGWPSILFVSALNTTLEEWKVKLVCANLWNSVYLRTQKS